MDELSVLHNFTIESQVQYHAPLAYEPPSVNTTENQMEYELGSDQLKTFVNSAEWSLGATISIMQGLSAKRRPPSFGREQRYRSSLSSFHPNRTTSSHACASPRRSVPLRNIRPYIQLTGIHRKSCVHQCVPRPTVGRHRRLESTA